MQGPVLNMYSIDLSFFENLLQSLDFLTFKNCKIVTLIHNGNLPFISSSQVQMALSNKGKCSSCTKSSRTNVQNHETETHEII